MQQGLFDDHNLLIIGYQRDLRHFRLADAHAKLLDLREKMAGRKDWNGQVHALACLRKKVEGIDAEDFRGLADLTSELRINPEYSLLKEDAPVIEEGLMRTIAGKLGPDDIGFITPDLHPARVFLRIEDYDLAITAVDSHCQSIGEHTALRQLQGYAQFRKGVKSMARRSMSLALFEDPLQCTEEWLVPEDLGKQLQTLRHSLQDEREAWLELPFVLWRARKIPVVTDVRPAERLLKELLESDPPVQAMDRTDRARRFLRLMYLSEISRLTDNDLFQVAFRRQQMKEADPEKFEIYMQAL